MVGASGAISGVIGGYLLLYPHVRVFTFIPIGFFLTSVALPAWVMLGYGFLIQFAGGLVSFARRAAVWPFEAPCRRLWLAWCW